MNEDILTKPIGDKEITRLEEKPVIVDLARIEEKGEKKTKILILSVKHPDQEELIDLSKVQFIDGKSVKTVGLWITQDEDKNIQKGTALARFMDFYNISQITELKDKTLKTVFDEKKYLCIKAY